MGYDLTELAQAAQRLRNANMRVIESGDRLKEAERLRTEAVHEQHQAMLELAAAHQDMQRLALDGDPRSGGLL